MHKEQCFVGFFLFGRLIICFFVHVWSQLVAFAYGGAKFTRTLCLFPIGVRFYMHSNGAWETSFFNHSIARSRCFIRKSGGCYVGNGNEGNMAVRGYLHG